METPLKLLWIDLRIDQTSPVAREQLGELFAVKHFGYTESVGADLGAVMPDAIFADFDYPDRASLRLVQELKIKYPSIPILMATIQHSEELAVWAFRSGFLDFFVKPIPAEELSHCQARIRRIVQQKRGQQNRRGTHAQPGNLMLPLEAAPASSVDARAVAPALHYISQNFHNKILRDEAAVLCSMSPFQFSRRFKEICGTSFSDYVVRYRIKEAGRLLANPSASVTSVAFAVGFNDVGYFSRMFKHHTGLTPSAHKSKLNRDGAPKASRSGQNQVTNAVDEVANARFVEIRPSAPN